VNEILLREIGEEPVDLAPKLNVRDLELVEQARLDGHARQTLREELPKARAGLVESVDLVRLHVHEHHVLADAAEEDVGILLWQVAHRPSYLGGLPFLVAERTVFEWGRIRKAAGVVVARDPLAHPEEAIRRVYAYVAYRIGPGPTTEDVVSETIERALRYRNSYDHRKGSPGAWLVGIASRVLADAQQERGRRVEEDVADRIPPSEDFTPAAAQKIDLQRAMALLDERSRELLALRYGADLKARQIGELLELRTNAVEVALTRALARLRAILEEGEPAAERPTVSKTALRRS
jgi:RNA polymerase sigma factor (sigma-70 family)